MRHIFFHILSSVIKMLIDYGSPAHIVSLLLAFGFVFIFYLLTKKATVSKQNSVVFLLAMLNLLQHFFKPFVWRHLYGTGFTHIETAYNVCAFLIIATPFFLCLNYAPLRQFLSPVGTAAGILPLLIPQWFIGHTVFEWEFIRGFVCHTLLLTTSLLPVLLRHVRFRNMNVLFTGIAFFGMLGVVFADNLVCILVGAVPGAEANGVWESMLRLNPLWMMRPPQNFTSLSSILEFFSFGVRLKHLEYVPVLWYFVPLFSVITLAAALLKKLDEQLSRQHFLMTFEEKGASVTSLKEHFSPVRRSSPCPSHT